MSLAHLRVHNLGVLDGAEVNPSSGLTVITGETGAGKTLLLGGLRLILGGRADSSAVGPHGDSAQIDGFFALDDGSEVGASRTVPKKGRSRGYLDGAIVSAGALTQRLGTVVEIVGQYDQVAIGRPARLLEIVDDALDDDGLGIKRAYDAAWRSMSDALERQAELGGNPQELARELDLARYQVAEIEAARLTVDLDSQLETDSTRLRNAHETAEHLAEVQRIIESVADSVGEVVARTRKASQLDPTIASLSERAEAMAAEVADLSGDVRAEAESLQSDPTALTEVEDRLTAIGELKRKYGRSVEDVLDYAVTTRARVERIAALLDEADQIDEVVASSRSAVEEKAVELTEARVAAAQRVSQRALTHLGDLGLEEASLELTLAHRSPGPTGGDEPRLLFASDSRLEPGPLASVASGGELSRLVLALRLATTGRDTATLVFDEVDTGIGGATALAMGRKLADLGSRFQVLCVTHLPQVAAHADTHYVVRRTAEGTAVVGEVSGADRLVELSRMLAGQPESDTGQLAAAELLEIASR